MRRRYVLFFREGRVEVIETDGECPTVLWPSAPVRVIELAPGQRWETAVIAYLKENTAWVANDPVLSDWMIDYLWS